MEDEFSLWLEKAKESLDDAVYSLQGHRYGLTAFCCQQALEKLLKATTESFSPRRKSPKKLFQKQRRFFYG